ncbi:Ubiquitinconjugating enzyme subfamily protein [Balamuthia mandrillaris]
MSSSTSSSGSKKKEEEKKKTKKSTTKDKKKEEKSAGKEKKSSSKDKKKEKKDKKSSASPDKKKTKKKTTTSKEGASPAETATMKKTGADYLPAIKKWLDSKSNTQGIEYVKTDDKKHRFHFKIGGEELAFTVSFPVEADDIWSVASDELAEEWATETNEMAMAATSATDVLKYATQQFEALSDAEFSEGEEEEEEEDYDDFDDDLGLEKVERDKGPKQKYMPEPEIDTSKFHIPAGYESSSVQAIIQEYREILKTDREERGYDASPLNDNIAQWELKLFGIPKDEPLWADMQRLGVEYITLHVTFPPNYPFNPPFIRVVRPRFAFRTGHVTVGGSICTLMLTNDGWVATYRLPQVIVDIRAMLTAGGGRLDTSQGSDYSESEAMVAFQRMLSTHGWKHWKA